MKSIRFRYSASDELSSLFEQFRLMRNDAMRIAVQFEKEHGGERVRSRFKFTELAYQRLKTYGLHTHYILSASEVAYSAYRNKNGKSVSFFKKAFLKLTSQASFLNHLILRIPAQPRRFIYLTLQASDYQLSFMDNPGLERGSITLDGRSVSITFTKQTCEQEARGYVGIDINERNAAWADSQGKIVIEDISEISELKERYKEIRAKIGRRTKNDKRIQYLLLSKYGEREKNRTIRRIHFVTRKIVEHAMINQFGIAMENLKGITKRYRKGNGKGAPYRGRMNTWTFREFQRQVEYKVSWVGFPVTYVNPKGTSRKCPKCGSSLSRVEGRNLRCPSCEQTEDRDVIAAKNILACVVPQDRPSK